MSRSYTTTSNSLSKEVSYYEKEVDENEAKLREMINQNKNPFDIKKFKEVLAESHMMIPDSKNRLEQALSDLAAYVESAEVQALGEEITADEWYVKARALLQREKGFAGGISEDVVEETDVSGLQDGEAF